MNDINIKYPTRKFDFSKITLTYPKSVASGSYFTKILYDNLPLYLQIPKCTTKQGLVKMAKKMSSELLLDNMNEETVGWFENLDNRCKELVQTHSEDWFGNPISTEDIDNAFGSTIRLYKSGKFSLVKTSTKLHPVTEIPVLSVYNEKQEQQPVESITADTNIVAILEITGIRFTSRNFNTEIEMKQIMIVEDSWEEDICFNRCVIVPRGRSVAEGGGGGGAVPPVTNSPQPTATTTDQPPTQILTNDQGDNSSSSMSPSFVIETFHEGESMDPSKQDSLEMYIPEDLKTTTTTPTASNSSSSSSLSGDLVPSSPITSIFLADEQLSSLEKTQQPQSELQVVLTPLPEISGMNEVDLQDLPLEEIIPADTSLGEITLNKPEQIYYELYRKTKQKAKETLLEAKRIKEQYQLDVSDLDDSDEDDDDEEEEL